LQGCIYTIQLRNIKCTQKCGWEASQMKPHGKQKQQMDLWDIVKTGIKLGFCDKQSETNK